MRGPAYAAQCKASARHLPAVAEESSNAEPPARRAGSLQAKHGLCRRMRHFLAGILNCAAPLVAVIPAIFLLPSGWPDFAASISSGRESLREAGDTIPAQR